MEATATGGGENPPIEQQEKIPPWAQEAFTNLTRQKVIQGYENGSFKPDKLVTRAELAVFVYRMASLTGLKHSERNISGFSDVKKEWFAEDVLAASKLGFIQGYEDGTFRPNEHVTREETAVLLHRFYPSKTLSISRFTDSGAMAPWAIEAIAALSDVKVLQGYEDGAFHGKRNLTRAELAVALDRLWKLINSQAPTHDIPLSVTVQTPDNNLMVGAQVFVHAQGKKMFLAEGKTDAKGKVAFSLPSGSYELYSVGQGSVAYKKVEVDSEHAAFQLKTEPAASFTGRVVAKNGSPAAGIVVALTTNPTFFAVTKSDGTFNAAVLPDRDYTVNLLEDSRIQSYAAQTDRPEGVFGAGTVILQGLNWLDSDQDSMPDCACSKVALTGTYHAPKAGEHMELGQLVFSSSQEAPSGGSSGNPTGGGSDTDRTPPEIPTRLIAIAGDKEADLSWKANNDDDLAGYKVYMSIDGGVTWTLSTDNGLKTLYKAKNLTNGNSYQFAATAYDKLGNESLRSITVDVIPSGTIEPQPGDHEPPSIPAGLTGNAGDSKVTLSWEANSEADLAGYNVYVSADAATWNTAVDVGLAVNHTALNLTNGVLYRFAVTAYDQSGNESDKSLMFTTTPESRNDGNNLPPDPIGAANPLSTTSIPSFTSMTEFLYTGNQPIQTGVAPGAIDEQLSAVLRGKVLDKSGGLLSGVKITLLDHSEWGQTLSRADGMFDMAVNGGGNVTVQYEKSGYMTVQRKWNVISGDYAALSDVVMTAYDTQVTVVDLMDAEQVQSARGSTVSDSAGQRTPTVIFPIGVTGSMRLPDGTMQQLNEIHLRATEYTVGEQGMKAMPGDLPSYVGYTHAVELSADEAIAARASKVLFNQPLYYYVENYLEFPVGEIVPTGYFDRLLGNWVASNNGKVIRIVSIDNGVAAIDTDGDGNEETEEEMLKFGLTEEERMKLAELYLPGQSLWRTPIEHFTPWDTNWPYGPPPDAISPPDKSPNFNQIDIKDPCKQSGSIIGCQNQTLGESIPIPGTGMALTYNSERTEGYLPKSRLEIPVSGANQMPASLKYMTVQIDIGGTTYSKKFAALSNQQWTFDWNGKDAYQRLLTSVHPYTVTVTYHYAARYYRSAEEFNQSFGRVTATGVVIGRADTQREVTTSRTWNGQLESPVNRYEESGIAGWSLDVHHIYDQTQKMLHTGDHQQLERSASLHEEFKITGDPDNSVNKTMLEQDFDFDRSILVAGTEREYYTTAYAKEEDNYLLIRKDYNGTFHRAGEFGPNFKPSSVRVDASGTIYVYSYEASSIIRKKRIESQWVTVAGTGTRGSGSTPIAEGSKANQAELVEVIDLEISPDGSLYFLQVEENNKVRLYRIGTDGRIAQMNDPDAVESLEDGPATKEAVGLVHGIMIGPDGSLYLKDTNTDYYGGMKTRYRKISPDGTLSRYAGEYGFHKYGTSLENGAAAIGTRFNANDQDMMDAQGRLYFQDKSRNEIYRVNENGDLELVQSALLKKMKEELNGTRLFLQAVESNGSLIVADGNNWYLKKHYRISPGETMDVPNETGMKINQFDGGNGRLIKTVHALTGALINELSYDDSGHLIAIHDGEGNQLSIERNASGVPLAIVEPGGVRTKLEVDANGELVAVTDNAGRSFKMVYDAHGLLTRFIDPNESISEYEYDSKGLLIRSENAMDGVKTLQRTDTANGYTVVFTDPEARTTVYKVEKSNGKLIRTSIDPAGGQTVLIVQGDDSQQLDLPNGTTVNKTFSPDPRWGMNVPVLQNMTATNADGRQVQFSESRLAVVPNGTLESYTVQYNINGALSKVQYEAAIRKYTETSAEGAVLYTYLDGKGRVSRIATADTSLSGTSYHYDERGRIERIERSDQTLDYVYDEHNRLKSVFDAFGSVKNYGYDDTGRVTSIETPGGKIYRKDYDESGNPNKITMPDGTDYNQQFNSLNQFAGFNPEGVEAWITLEHSSSGKLEQSQLRSGRETNYLYEQSGGKRMTGMNDPDILRTFTYTDATERVQKIQSVQAESKQDIAYTYDGADVSQMIWSGAAEGQFDYTYDALSNVTGFQTSVTRQVYGTLTNTTVNTPISFDRDNRMTRFGAFEFNRSGPGRTIGSISDGKLNSKLGYDEIGRRVNQTTELDGDEVHRIEYTYDKRGLVTDKTITSTEGQVKEHYEFDRDGQLISTTRYGADGKQDIETYEYDVNKNRISRQVNGVKDISMYDKFDQLKKVGETSYLFDADGFLKQRGNDLFRYGIRGELLEATVIGATYKYTYDAIGRRTARQDESGGKFQYLYGHPHSLQMLTTSIDPNGVMTQYDYDENGLLLGLERAGVRYYVITDGVGTPQLVLDTDGKAVKKLRYDSYGLLLDDSNPAFELVIGFAGGIGDGATGLTRFGARDYDAFSGRWTARDPILHDSGQANLYAYVNNNPVLLRDPCGMFCIGGSLYEGIGGGGKVCATDEGFSACVEFGFGVGGGLDVNPFEDLSKDAIGVEVTGKLSYGPASLTLGMKVEDSWDGGCPSLGGVAKADFGPARIDLLDLSKSGVKGKDSQMYDDVRDLMKNKDYTPGGPIAVKAEAAIKAKLCKPLRW
ncbi:S-layer homology domain-containing protein [Paenibacillus sp. 2TAB23]|uniref:S-layer homology domain-containing protein n=1 Tax=Paenibacillus sp. 2TAB23 TaxID=3233004 RepID=UPI003F94A779